MRRKGLCFNCDEKFTHGHRCASKLFLFIADDDELDPEIPPPEDLPPLRPNPDEPPQPQISLHAILGHPEPETLRMVGFISKWKVIILIDGGSMHNFIHESLVSTLSLTAQSTRTLCVIVDNGSEIACSQVCSNVII